MIASLKLIDIFLNCLPTLNTVNSLIQLACRSQWHTSITESSASEASSFKRNFQILVLNKSSGDLFFDALPLVGNIIALVKCVIALIHGFENDLEKAVAQENEDAFLLCLANGDIDNLNKAETILKKAFAQGSINIFHLCLANRDLKTHINVEAILRNAAISPDNTYFKALLEQGTWNAGDLLNALNSETFQVDNVNSIFDYWNANKKALNDFDKTPQNNFQNPNYDVWFPKWDYRLDIPSVLTFFLKKNKPELFDRMLELLPNNVISFNGMQLILSDYTFTSNRYDRETGASWQTAALTKEQRDQLIQKSQIAHIDFLLPDLKQYYDSTLSSRRLNDQGYLEVRFDILTSLIQHAYLQTQDIVELIIYALIYTPLKVFQEKPLVVQFLDDLLRQHETAIGTAVKRSILQAMPYTYKTKADWAKKWKIALTA